MATAEGGATVEIRVRKIIVEQLGVKEEDVVLSASFVGDLGADSLDTVEIVMAMEDEFDIQIPDDIAEKIIKVGDAVSFIEKHLAERDK